MPRILLIDPWQSFITRYDENNFKDMSTATDFIDELIEEFGLTVFITTHTGKDQSKGTRGHSSLAGWRDTLFKLKPSGNNLFIEVSVEPRWGEPVEPFGLKFHNGTVWPRKLFQAQAEKIRQYVQDHGGQVTKDDVGQMLGLGAEGLRQDLHRAEKANAIKVDGGNVTLPAEEES
jgi:hypothetical protein